MPIVDHNACSTIDYNGFFGLLRLFTLKNRLLSQKKSRQYLSKIRSSDTASLPLVVEEKGRWDGSKSDENIAAKTDSIFKFFIFF